MGRQANTKFILQIKLIWGFYCPSRVSHVTGVTITSGIGLRSDGGCLWGLKFLMPLTIHLSCFALTVYPSCVCITTALSDTSVASFHDFILASAITWYITGSPPKAHRWSLKEALIGNVVRSYECIDGIERKHERLLCLF